MSLFIFIICIEVLLIKLAMMDEQGMDSADSVLRAIRNINVEAFTAEAY